MTDTATTLRPDQLSAGTRSGPSCRRRSARPSSGHDFFLLRRRPRPRCSRRSSSRVRSVHRDDAVVHDVLRRVRRAAGRGGHLRPLRRPRRPQEAARLHDDPDGRVNDGGGADAVATRSIGIWGAVLLTIGRDAAGARDRRPVERFGADGRPSGPIRSDAASPPASRRSARRPGWCSPTARWR